MKHFKAFPVLISAVLLMMNTISIPINAVVADAEQFVYKPLIVVESEHFSFRKEADSAYFQQDVMELPCLSYEKGDPAPNDKLTLIVTGNTYNRNASYLTADGQIFAPCCQIRGGAENIRVGDIYFASYKDIQYEDLSGEYVDYGELEYAGNGLDIYGQDFQKVLRCMLCFADYENTPYGDFQTSPLCSTVDFIYGDTDQDETVSIMDVILFNHYLLGNTWLVDYSKMVSDTNADGVLDATDSLNLLKVVVELVSADALPMR